MFRKMDAAPFPRQTKAEMTGPEVFGAVQLARGQQGGGIAAHRFSYLPRYIRHIKKPAREIPHRRNEGV